MKFGINDNHLIINHWLLNSNDETVKEVAKSRQGTASFDAVVTVNGIELDFSDLEKWMNDFLEDSYNRKMEAFANQEKEVQKRLDERMEKEAQPILDKMYELQRVLEEAGDIIKPYWKK